MNPLLVLASADRPQPANSDGAEAKAPSVEWKAQWIWQEEDCPPNSWVAFRKEIDLDEAPGTVTAKISADSKYWLWINGKLVVFEGSVATRPEPAPTLEAAAGGLDTAPRRRSQRTPGTKRSISAATFKPDKNTVAVLVWYWGRETHKGTHIDSGQGGFLFQADLGDKLLVSDRSWKVRADPRTSSTAATWGGASCSTT